MANRKISELQSRTPALSDLILVGDPSSGYSYKCTVTALATIIETDIADTYVTLGTTQTISGAKTFSNNLTLTSVANATTTQTKFLTLNASNVVNYRTGAEVLADIGGASSSSVSGTTNYLAKFTSSSAIGNSVIFESSGTIGINTTTPAGTIDISGVGGIALNGRRVINNSAADLFIGGLSGLPGVGTDTITFYTNNTSRATLNVSGNFGLGTSAPANILDIYNTNGFQNRIRITGTTNTSQLQFSNTGGDFYLGIDNSTASGFGVGGYSRVLYSSNAYPMVFFTNALERMRLDASGRLGIGVTSPSYLLDVSGTNDQYIRITTSTAGGYAAGIRMNSTGSREFGIFSDGTLRFYDFTSSATRMTIDASGNLGLGVTPSAWSGMRAMDIGDGSFAISADGAGAGDGSLTWNGYYNGTNWIYKYTGGVATRYRQNELGHAWFYAPSGVAGNSISFTQAMTLDASGNLGLGVSPASWYSTGYSALQVRGLSLYSAAGNDGNVVSNAYLSTAPAWTYLATGTATRYEQGSGSHKWYNAPSGVAGNSISFTQAMTLASTGNLLVGGTTDAGFKLDVTGNGRFNIPTAGDVNYIILNDDSWTVGDRKSIAWFSNTTKILSIDGLFEGGSNVGMRFSTYSGGVFNQDVLTISASGNLGLGVSPSAWGSGWTALQIKSGGGSIWSDGGQRTFYSTNAFYNGTNRIYVTTGTATEYAQTGGQHIWYTAASGTAGTTISFTQAMVLDASGRLGIGSTTPDTRTNIVKNALTKSWSADADDILAIENNGATLVDIRSSNAGAGYLSFSDGDARARGLITYSHASDDMRFNTAGGERVRILSGGQVGIGTSAPTANTVLDVSTSGTRGYIITQSTSATAGSEAGIRIKTNTKDYYISTDNTSDALKIFDGTAIAERLRITSAGLIGIGTSSPSTILNIASASPVIRLNPTTQNNPTAIEFGVLNAGTNGYAKIDATNETTYDTNLRFFTNTSSSTTQVERLRITSAGNVGIGTSSPTVPLTVMANTGGNVIRLLGRSADGFAFLTFRNNADNATNGEIGISDAQNMLFYTGGSERARITSGGNVGLGISTPLAVTNYQGLSINGTNGSFISLYSGATQHARLEVNTGTEVQIKSITSIPVIFGTNNAERLRITETGNIGINTSTPSTRLHVFGTSGATTTLVEGATNASAYGKLELRGRPAGAGQSCGWLVVSSTEGGQAATNVGGIDFTMANASGNAHNMQFSTHNGTSLGERMRIKSTGQVRFVPLAADPAGAESGDVYYNSTTNKLKVYNGTAWTDLH